MIYKLFTAALTAFFATTNCYALLVGESYGDAGTVFCSGKSQDIKDCDTTLGASGEYGLIMANTDQTTSNGIHWGDRFLNFTTKAQSTDDGLTNTKIIITALPKPNDNANKNAAWLCNDYRDLEKHTDWYLPSIDELDKMYVYAKENNLIGNNCKGEASNGAQCFAGTGRDNENLLYWSSTESDSNSEDNAWAKHFSSGERFKGGGKRNNYLVRAIRSFGPSTSPFNALKKEMIQNNRINALQQGIGDQTAKLDNVVEKQNNTDTEVKRLVELINTMSGKFSELIDNIIKKDQ